MIKMNVKKLFCNSNSPHHISLNHISRDKIVKGKKLTQNRPPSHFRSLHLIPAFNSQSRSVWGRSGPSWEPTHFSLARKKKREKERQAGRETNWPLWSLLLLLLQWGLNLHATRRVSSTGPFLSLAQCEIPVFRPVPLVARFIVRIPWPVLQALESFVELLFIL